MPQVHCSRGAPSNPLVAFLGYTGNMQQHCVGTILSARRITWVQPTSTAAAAERTLEDPGGLGFIFAAAAGLVGWTCMIPLP